MKTILFFIGILTGVNPLLWAETLNYQSAIQKYIDVSTQIKAAGLNAQAAQNDYKEAWTTLVPSIDLTGSVGEQKLSLGSLFGGSGVLTSRSYFVGLKTTHAFIAGGRIWGTLDLKENLRDSSRLKLKSVKQKLILGFSEKLYRFQALHQKLDLVKQSQKTQEGFLNITKSKFKRGNVRSYEMDQVTAEYYSYYPRIRELERNLVNLSAEIHSDLLVPPGTLQFSLDRDAPVARVDLLSEDRLLQEASERRPDIKESELAVEIAELNKTIVMSAHYPSLVFQGQWGYLSSSSDNLFDTTDTGNSFSLVLSIPIFSGLSSVYARRSAENKIMINEKDLAQKRRDLKAEVVSALEDYNASLESIRYTKKWAESSESALVKGGKSYRTGIINNTQLVQLQQSKERAASAYIDAKVALRMAVLRLKYTLGRDIF